MLQFFADYHTHTTYSHGKGTVEENVVAAIQKGLKRIAITDHGLRHLAFGMKRKDLASLRQEVDRLNDKYAGRIEVLAGVEANLMGRSGRIDLTDEDRKYLDIVLMGHHRSVIMERFSDNWHFSMTNAFAMRKEKKEEIRQQNTDAYILAVEKNGIDILTHPRYIIDVDVARLARACKKANTAMELSAHHLNLSVEDMKAAKETGVTFVVDSDAHRPEHVGEFQDVLPRIEEAGISASQIANAVGYEGKMWLGKRE